MREKQKTSLQRVESAFLNADRKIEMLPDPDPAQLPPCDWSQHVAGQGAKCGSPAEFLVHSGTEKRPICRIHFQKIHENYWTAGERMPEWDQIVSIKGGALITVAGNRKKQPAAHSPR